MSVPQLSYFTRDKESIKIFDFDSSQENGLTERTVAPFPLPTPKAALWSPDGLALALVDPVQGVQVVCFTRGDSTETMTFSLPSAPKTTQSFLWSPTSSVVVSVAPGQKGSTEHNIHVWRRSAPGEGYNLQASYSHPKLEKGAKVLQWTPDEGLCARLLPDGRVHVLQGSDLSTEPLVELKLAHAVTSFEFAPVRARGSLRGRLAIFVSDVRDDMQRVVGPAEVIILELSSAEGGAIKSQEKVKTPVAAGQAAELLWNSTGTALIAHCQTEVDETGQSYYGGSKLVFISCDGECQKDLMDTQEGLVTSGSIVQAVAWSPTRDEFILIHGFQPSQASLFSWDERTKKVALAKILLEKAHRNTIRFNHFGSLVCLAGFGNLAGQVDFFGRADDTEEEKCDFVRVASCHASCTVSAEWAPDGRHFITSVLAPRMRVDNGASIWRALTGTKIAGTLFEELYDVQWRPEPPESLRFLDVSIEEIESASKEHMKTGASEGAAKQKQAYRPPKARGEGASTVAAMMRGEVAAPDADDRKRRQNRQQQLRQREEDSAQQGEQGLPQDPRDRRSTGDVASLDADLHVQQQMSPDKVAQQSPVAQQQLQQLQQQLQQQQQAQRQAQAVQQRQNQGRDPAAAAAAAAALTAQQQQQQQALAQQAEQLRQREAQLLQQQQRDLAAAHQQQQREQAAARERALQQQVAAVAAARDRPQVGGLQAASLEALQALQNAQAAHMTRMTQAAGDTGPAVGFSGYPGHSQTQQALHHQQHQQQRLQQVQHLQQQLQQQQLQQQQLQQERQRQQIQAQQAAAAQEQAARHAAAARVAQQQATQGISSHGLKMQCPPTGWEYIDPKGNKQGPFSLLEMQQWNQMGYFRPELPMRCDPNDEFIPFSQLFGHPLIPFQSYPKRPPQKNSGYRMS